MTSLATRLPLGYHLRRCWANNLPCFWQLKVSVLSMCSIICTTFSASWRPQGLAGYLRNMFDLEMNPKSSPPLVSANLEFPNSSVGNQLFCLWFKLEEYPYFRPDCWTAKLVLSAHIWSFYVLSIVVTSHFSRLCVGILAVSQWVFKRESFPCK